MYRMWALLWLRLGAWLLLDLRKTGDLLSLYVNTLGRYPIYPKEGVGGKIRGVNGCMVPYNLRILIGGYNGKI